MKRVAVLGCTGSIGVQTLDVIRQHPDELSCVALACGRRVEQMRAVADEFGVADECCASAADGMEAVVALCRLPEVDIVVNALVGAAGLRASYETLAAGKVLALANKESLVVGGDLIMPLARSAVLPNGGLADACAESGGTGGPCADLGAGVSPLGSAAGLQHSPASTPLTHHGRPAGQLRGLADAPCGAIMPIDSEHGAIFQCLLGERREEVTRLWVTASGGPFRGHTTDELHGVTPDEALAHPTWNMGPKITIDSSTLMNKGLEVIEAHHLFNMPYDQIDVVVQPQSAIHSMVEFADGSVKAHLGTTDMRIPIQFALSYPERWAAPVAPLDFRTLGSLEFYAPDAQTFRCLALARAAGERGGTLPCAMNAANEVAVAAFLDRACGYLDIAGAVEAVMDAHDVQPVTSLEQLAWVDSWAREEASRYLATK